MATITNTGSIQEKSNQFVGEIREFADQISSKTTGAFHGLVAEGLKTSAKGLDKGPFLAEKEFVEVKSAMDVVRNVDAFFSKGGHAVDKMGVQAGQATYLTVKGAVASVFAFVDGVLDTKLNQSRLVQNLTEIISQAVGYAFRAIFMVVAVAIRYPVFAAIVALATAASIKFVIPAIVIAIPSLTIAKVVGISLIALQAAFDVGISYAVYKLGNKLTDTRQELAGALKENSELLREYNKGFVTRAAETLNAGFAKAKKHKGKIALAALTGSTLGAAYVYAPELFTTEAVSKAFNAIKSIDMKQLAKEKLPESVIAQVSSARDYAASFVA